MTPKEFTEHAINPALALLPAKMDSTEARLMLIAIALQESRLEHRRQLGNGPARGLLQFEKGTSASKGGVWGVYLHKASCDLMETLCAARKLRCHPDSIYPALEFDDVLAVGVARLLLFTDPLPLPKVDDVEGAWNLYAKRTWRPGKPHRDTFDKFHVEARRSVMEFDV